MPPTNRLRLMKNNEFIKCVLIIILTYCPLLIRAQQESFGKFIIQFCSDSSFQVSRIKFPLLYLTWDYDTDKEVPKHITKEDYRFDNLFYREDMDAYTVFYDNFDCKFRDTGKMVFRWRGFTDMDRRYYFKRIRDKWFLIKILDYDG